MTEHDRNRELVCLKCLFKSCRLASETEIKTFKENCIENYDKKGEYMPVGICNKCVLALAKLSRGDNCASAAVVGDYTVCVPGNYWKTIYRAHVFLKKIDIV